MSKEYIKNIIDNISEKHSINFEDTIKLLHYFTDGKLNEDNEICTVDSLEGEKKELKEYLFNKARVVAVSVLSNKVYMRGLIEFSNYCKNDCLYCGIRNSNKEVQRYRLLKEDILLCAKKGYELGLRTFVLQSGEDLYFTKEIITDIVSSIKKEFSNTAVTLSIGEKSFEYYKALKTSGADRFLLRHETAVEEHYKKLHPINMSFENRMKCIKELKQLNFQTGVGFMVGSPYQSIKNIANDILFIQQIKPEMIGIGPFIPCVNTPFENNLKGSVLLTLIIISILRLLLPNALLPSTTALGSIIKGGREMGILAGANVVMPNLSPLDVRKKYLLYNDKISSGEETLEGIKKLRESINNIGYSLIGERGDHSSFKP